MPPLPLLQHAGRCEDAASGIHRFSDSLPQYASRIAIIVNELFAITAVLRRIHGEEGHKNHGPSFSQFRDVLEVAIQSLELTLDDIFNMFVQVGHRPEQMVWEELNQRLELEASFSLAVRLKLYHDFFNAQLRMLAYQHTINPEPLRQSITLLLNAQERARPRPQSRPVRARRSSRPPLHRLDTPLASSIHSDEWDTEYLNRPRAPAPEPPQPLSPAFTSSSSRTMGSSHTSYSGGVYSSAPPPPIPVHWSLRVFDGRHPTTAYQPEFRSHERSVCYGSVEPDAVRNLALDGFLPALQVAFDEESLSIRFYWRPSDHRARVLVAVKDAYGNPLHYCQPLNNLKIVRDRSCLQLCRARREDGQYTLWARLNFYFHERMVLFYSTFIAMKRQDQNGVIHPQLADAFELEAEGGEDCQFSGQIKHDGMLHAVRIFRDQGSGVVRLEAAALRGKSTLGIKVNLKSSKKSDASQQHLYMLTTLCSRKQERRCSMDGIYH